MTGARLVAGRLQPSWDTASAQAWARPPESFGRSTRQGVLVSKERQMLGPTAWSIFSGFAV